MISDTLLARLRTLSERREEVEHLLGDPGVMSDQNQFRSLSREHHELTPVVECYGAYQRTGDDLEAAQSMLADDDAELRDIAAAQGMDGAALLAAGKSDEIGAVFDAYTQEGIDRHVFGAPTYIYKDEPFWGQDRLDFVERAQEHVRN